MTVAQGVPDVSCDDAPALISTTDAWKDLAAHKQEIDKTHLRDLIEDQKRCEALTVEYNGVYCDYARQRVTEETMSKLYELADEANLRGKINAMFSGEHINSTEDRAVLHVATRAPRNKVINVDGKNIVPDVWDVLDKIKDFTEKVRNGEWLGHTGKPLTSVVAIGIGGSFLGPLFVHTALRTCGEAADGARGRQLRFLANVDPVDVARSLNGLDPETTLVVVVSKVSFYFFFLHLFIYVWAIGLISSCFVVYRRSPPRRRCSTRAPCASGSSRPSARRRSRSTWSPCPPTSSSCRSLASVSVFSFILVILVILVIVRMGN